MCVAVAEVQRSPGLPSIIVLDYTLYLVEGIAGRRGGRRLKPNPHSTHQAELLAWGYIHVEEEARFSNLCKDVIQVKGGLDGASGDSDN